MLRRPSEHHPVVTVGRVAASLAYARSPAGRVRVVRSHAADASIYADLATPLGRGLYRYGWTDPLARYLRSLVDSGDTVVDGGANVGLMTLPLAAAVGPSGRVISFEPSTGTRALLKANVALNAFGNVTIRGEALSDQDGVVRFEELEPGAGVASIAYGDRAGTRVPAMTLDSAIGDAAVRLIKLDLEGAEVMALEGAREILRLQRPLIVLEVEPERLAQAGQSVGALRAYTVEMGYEASALRLVRGALGAVGLDDAWTMPSGATENVLLRPRSS